jgi:3-keto-disaccharide hydrolase
MRSILALLFFASAAGNPFAGRWDLTLTSQGANQATWPQWMELVDNGGTPQVRVQPRGGGVFVVKDVKTEGSHLTLGVSRNVTWELDVSGDRITGTQKGTAAAQIAGVRAPVLKRPMPKAWTNPEPIFNGKDLTGWEPTDPKATNNWVAEDGVLLNKAHGANLKTTRKFEDFKLHIEFNCPEEGNSGIYLRGRDEIQVAYEKPGVNDKFHDMGAIYGFIPASVELPRKPGTWESFDVTLVGRYVTIVRNGVKTVDNQEMPGITGGALDSNESEPGPFYLQGDHTGGMKYRNITVSVPK